jgi:galactofuranosylgalactofuranosylrhamnosyl-N-acetylglucosaminyl-diphospho-decaprenol beta-1,5/1,6-galactofuranosyltransferase
VLHQVRQLPAGATDAPEREVASPDAGWWTLARLDSALVATADGTGLAWLRRDRSATGRALADAVRVHRELLQRWPELAPAYRAALPDLVGEDPWRRTLGLERPPGHPVVDA